MNEYLVAVGGIITAAAIAFLYHDNKKLNQITAVSVICCTAMIIGILIALAGLSL